MEDKKLMVSSAMALGFVVFILCASQPNAASSVSCSDAFAIMVPCKEYFMGWGGDEPTPRCCLAALRLTELAETQETRTAICECFRQSGSSVKPRRVQLLRHACAGKLPISSGRRKDCSIIL